MRNSPSSATSFGQPSVPRTNDYRAWIANVLDDLDAMPDVEHSTIDHIPAVTFALSKRCSEAAHRGFAPLSTALARLVRLLAATFITYQQATGDDAQTAGLATRHLQATLDANTAQIRTLANDALDEVLAAYFLYASAESTRIAS